jgi:hypothetical protein
LLQVCTHQAHCFFVVVYDQDSLFDHLILPGRRSPRLGLQ